ncbi:hypothetical protein BDBG_04710 [Blastomyces gilchristii SLH14081]|uniref:Uncharacterized protein n=1 Tax=Blastomyces gilchristii (strain SLH14081) TaxID=559298 RepID=A0A179UMW0_BLAGS|nr:uncharacterized protein BDBG_04710 [Blastomyces gilchristii SLH14081]OAT09163.1 hypothetical protein BDBG_04710 [Blastomyces gilchristii SLH14081]
MSIFGVAMIVVIENCVDWTIFFEQTAGIMQGSSWSEIWELSHVWRRFTVPGMYYLGIGCRAADLSMHEIDSMQWEGGLQILYYRPFRYSLAKSGMVALYTQLASSATHLKFLYAFGAVVFFHRVAATLIDEMDSSTDSMETEDDDIYLHDRLAHVEPNVSVGLVFYFSIGILTICVTIARQMTNAIALNNPLEFF